MKSITTFTQASNTFVYILTCTIACHFAFQLVSHTHCEACCYHIGHLSSSTGVSMCWLLGYGRIEMIENLSTPPNLKIKSVSLFFLVSHREAPNSHSFFSLSYSAVWLAVIWLVCY